MPLASQPNLVPEIPVTTDLLVESLMPGRTELIRSIFAANGAVAPTILWSPQPHEFQNPMFERFHQLHRQLARPDGTLAPEHASIEAFAELSDWLLILDVEQEGPAFRYRHYGRRIAETYGQDMTGLTTRDFSSHIATFFTAIYCAMLRRREWILSEHEPPRDIFVRAWRRLLAPVMDDAGRIVGMIGVNFPENNLRDGLELLIDPVFITDTEQRVVFANRTARMLFGLPKSTVLGHNLFDLTGIRLPPDLDPMAYLGRRSVHDRIEVTEIDGVCERFAMTMTSALFRSDAYFILVVRILGD